MVDKHLDALVNFVDNFFVFKVLDKITSSADESIAWNCLANAAAMVLAGGGVAIAIGTVVCGIMFVPWLLFCFLYWLLWIAIPYIGWGVIWGLGFVGCLLVHAVQGIGWFFTALWLWEQIFAIVGWTFVGLIASAIATFCGYHILTSPHAMRFWNWTSFKFNGYWEAREKAAKARRDYQWKVGQGEIVPPPPSKVASLWATAWKLSCEKAEYIFGGIFKFFYSAKVEWKGGTAKVLSPMATMWAFLVAIKKGACPIVEFVEGGQLTPIPDADKIPPPEKIPLPPPLDPTPITEPVIVTFPTVITDEPVQESPPSSEN